MRENFPRFHWRGPRVSYTCKHNGHVSPSFSSNLEISASFSFHASAMSDSNTVSSSRLGVRRVRLLLIVGFRHRSPKGAGKFGWTEDVRCHTPVVFEPRGCCCSRLENHNRCNTSLHANAHLQNCLWQKLSCGHASQGCLPVSNQIV